MPASIAWASPPRPVMQMFASQKRKAEDGDQSMECGGQATEYDAAKRRCVWQEQGQGDGMPHSVQMQQQMQQQQQMLQQQQQMQQQNGFPMQTSNEVPTAMQQSPIKTWCTQVQQQQVHRSPSPWPSEQIPNNNTLPAQTQENFIMNINDETYAAPSQTDEACMAMDSDCAPDPSQYGRPSQCRELCGVVGEAERASDKIRCFCRPTWDGVMSMKPYVSDYY